MQRFESFVLAVWAVWAAVALRQRAGRAGQGAREPPSSEEARRGAREEDPHQDEEEEVLHEGMESHHQVRVLEEGLPRPTGWAGLHEAREAEADVHRGERLLLPLLQRRRERLLWTL